MAKLTPIYRLPYLTSGEPLTGPIDRTRFLAVDRQLEAIFTFLGNGVISGWQLQKNEDNPKLLVVTRGSGVVASVAAATTSDFTLNAPERPTDSSLLRSNVYLKLLGQTPYTARGEFVITTETFSVDSYLPLGYITVDSSGNIVEINTSEESGRKSLELIRFISSLIQDHVHTGAPGEPDKIDLFDHVKGVLSAANIEDLPASKITSGIIHKDRFNLSHNDLSDTGTLTHQEIDSLIEQLQTLNRLLFGDIMTANLIQLILSMKHVFSNIDDYMQNFAAIIPGVGNSDLLDPKSFIDINSTTAELDFDSHLIRGKFVDSKELGQYTINTEGEFKSGDYNSTFVTITNNLSQDQAYGYGYGKGLGEDYFDVIWTNLQDTFSLDETIYEFEGGLTGYGVSDIFGNDFETTFPSSYGYGYGFEYGFSYNGSEGNAIVYLNPLGADLLIHDQDEGDTGVYSLDTSSRATSYPLVSASPSPSSLNTSQLLAWGSQAASLYDGVVAGVKRRGSNVASESSPGTTNFYTYSSVRNFSSGTSNYLETDKSIMYAAWVDEYDVTDNNFLNFILKQDSGTFDANWTYDYDMDLIIEVTNYSFGSDTARYYYRYTGGSGSPSTYRFFDRGGDEPFTFNEIDDDGTPIATISAELISANMQYIDGYIESDTQFTVGVNEPTTGLADPGWDALKTNVTGIYLLARSDEGYDGEGQTAIPIAWPQGQRIDLEPDGSSSTMLVDIDRVFFSGSFEYPVSLTNNRINDLSIDFPDPVSLESISWVSTEPGNSVVFIQIKKNASPVSGGDPGEVDYRDNLFFTNKPEAFQSGGIYNTLFTQSFGEDPGDTLRTYVLSGQALPSVFSEIYDASYGFSIRVVLLPTQDKLATPVLNSISINYSSETSGGTLTIATQDDFDSYRSAENTKIESGVVSILETGRTGNIIYGSNKKVVELKPGFSERYTDVYTGLNLPKTILQTLNESPAGLVGDVTDLKVLKNGNIMFLDRDASRIIEVDKNRNIVNMYCSEFVFNQVYGDEAAVSIPASEKGKIVDVIFNRELGNNGVLYITFSHELDAWFNANGVVTPSEAATEEEINVRPEGFNIRYKGLTRNLSDSEEIHAVDRGVLAFFVSAEMSEWIESIPSAIIDASFDPDATTLIPGVNSIVQFQNTDVPVENLNGANQRVSIVKIGNKGLISNSYNKMYLPIQGIVAFNIDENGYLYILKKARPYSWDTDYIEPWYIKINPNIAYKDSTSIIESNYNFPQGSFTFTNESNPSFETNGFFGIKGSIEKKGEFLLICITGEKKDGLYVFRKDPVSNTYGLPTQIILTDDGTYPMDARFDPKTFSDNDYGDIYVALSDLKRTLAGSDSISRFEKIKPDGTRDWAWGQESSDVSIKFSIGANSVRPLAESDDDSVVFST